MQKHISNLEHPNYYNKNSFGGCSGHGENISNPGNNTSNIQKYLPLNGSRHLYNNNNNNNLSNDENSFENSSNDDSMDNDD